MATQLSAKARVTGLLLGLSGLFLGTQLWRAAAHEAAPRSPEMDPDSAIVQLLTGAGECATVAHVFTRPAPAFGIDAISRGEWTEGFYAGDASGAAAELGGEAIAPTGEANWVLVTDSGTGARSAVELRPAGELADGTPIWVSGNEVRAVPCPDTSP